MQAEHLNHLIGRIYDCAVEPDLWPETLAAVRDAIKSACVAITFVDSTPELLGGQPMLKVHLSEWDKSWFDKLIPMLPTTPGLDEFMHTEIDGSWSQMQMVEEAEFQATPFYQHWVKPQGLRDCASALFLKRNRVFGTLSCPTFADQPLVTQEMRDLCSLLAPHIRRSILIGDTVDQGKLMLRLYRQVLDEVSTGIVLVSRAGAISFVNAAADAELSRGTVLSAIGGKLVTRRRESQRALTDAIERAVTGDAALGVRGIGVPLYADNGERAVAYVLPMVRSDVRLELGTGLAAVFLTGRADAQPPHVEILRTVLDVTATEARVALALLDGQKPAGIAAAMGVSISTIRTHLQNLFAKTGTRDQTGLVALIKGLVLPIRA